jgi:hypothetical protein
MRTSGGGREGWMTAIPIAVILLFVTVVAGGPNELLKVMDRQLRLAVEWVVQWTK